MNCGKFEKPVAMICDDRRGIRVADFACQLLGFTSLIFGEEVTSNVLVGGRGIRLAGIGFNLGSIFAFGGP